MSRHTLCVPLLLSLGALPAQAGVDVEVSATGMVIFNQINGGVLGNVATGDTATLSFQLDSTDFVDSPNFPTRGYVIDETSFVLDFGSGNQIGLQNPFPAGQTPYFVLRDNDPAVDGFFTSTDLDFPVGVPLDQTGVLGQFMNAFSLGYTGGTLSSLNLLDALGTYDFTGLTVFNWTVDDGPFQPLGIDFEQMTIALAGPTPYCDPANANSVSPGGAVLSSVGGFGTDAAEFLIENIPNQPGILISGDTDPGALPFGCGMRCVSGNVIRFGTYFPSGNTLSVTIDMSTSTNNRVQYWYRDPAHQAVCGDVFNLSNALVE